MAADRPALLVVEDDPGLQKQLRWTFADLCEVLTAGDRAEALSLVGEHHPPVVLLDLGLPPDPANASEGLAALSEIVSAAPDTKVIVVTGNDDRANALRAVELGAYDYYQKPVDADELTLIVSRALRLFELEAENRRLQVERAAAQALDGVVGSSPVMQAVCRQIERIAPTDATVLLTGESGTGKEVLARGLHGLSERAEGRFVAINCAAIPENLLESELFGYEKGAFTGAAKTTPGKFETADGGTLLLDEVGDLPMSLQAKLLRFLQERVVERIGGRREIPVDVRVVCATHKDLTAMVGEGSFREDLYYRISEITVEIPALRERGADALLIARAILRRLADQQGGRVRRLSDAAVQAIAAHDWPGNVRELENRLKRATILAEGRLIEPADLDLGEADDAPRSLKEVREQAEATALREALERWDGHIGKAADSLGVSRPTVYHLMKKYGIAARARA